LAACNESATLLCLASVVAVLRLFDEKGKEQQSTKLLMN